MTLDTRCLPLSDSSLDMAVGMLRAGDVVAFPTETVYGLGADASNPDAVRKIFEAKGRPADHPLIVHLADDADPLQWAAEWHPLAQALSDVFWPGPLTLIVPRRDGVSSLVTGGQSTVGLRCPGHAGAQALLKAFGGALAAPSANRFGRISPTRASHVMEELSGRIPLVLDGGDADVGIESTIIDVSRGFPVLLRPGDLNPAHIEQVIGQRLARPDAQAPRVSGSLESHYAPQRRLQLFDPRILADLLSSLALTGGLPVAVLAWSDVALDAAVAAGLVPEGMGAVPGKPGVCMRLPADVHAVAHHLYAALRWADHQPVRAILCEQAPSLPEWEGVADRLRRASAGQP